MPKYSEEFMDSVCDLFKEHCEQREYIIKTVCKNDKDAEKANRAFTDNALFKSGSIETAINLKMFASVHALLEIIQELKDDNKVLHDQIHDMNIIINKLLKEE